LQASGALIPLRLERVRVLESALAVLVGMEPAEMFSKLDFGNKRLTLLRLEAVVPRSLPSDLLRRRPDIRAAEAGLIATTADIGVAIAERFPRLDLASFAGSTPRPQGICLPTLQRLGGSRRRFSALSSILAAIEHA